LCFSDKEATHIVVLNWSCVSVFGIIEENGLFKTNIFAVAISIPYSLRFSSAFFFTTSLYALFYVVFLS
jgi:hypothetical protein